MTNEVGVNNLKYLKWCHIVDGEKNQPITGTSHKLNFHENFTCPMLSRIGRAMSFFSILNWVKKVKCQTGNSPIMMARSSRKSSHFFS